MYIDRQQIVEELRLRRLIRKAIHIAEAKRANPKEQYLAEENRMRKVVHNLIMEDEVGDTEDSPYNNTGLNTLNTLFDNILKTVETGYKELASSKEQRDSFSSHMLKAIENVLAPLRALEKSNDELSEEIDIQVSPDRPEDMADIRKDKEEQAVEDFGIDGVDLTGRDKAYETFNKIEAFYDGLLMNLDLYFKKFEDEIQPSVEAPETGAEVDAGLDAAPAQEEDELDLADIANL